MLEMDSLGHSDLDRPSSTAPATRVLTSFFHGLVRAFAGAAKTLKSTAHAARSSPESGTRSMSEAQPSDSSPRENAATTSKT